MRFAFLKRFHILCSCNGRMKYWVSGSEARRPVTVHAANNYKTLDRGSGSEDEEDTIQFNDIKGRVPKRDPH